MVQLIILFGLVFLVVLIAIIFLLIFSNAVYSALLGWFKPGAPPVPLPKEALQRMVEHINLDSASVVYDLGSGDGRVIAALYRRQPAAKFIGVEHAPWPYLLACWQTRHLIGPNFKLILGDIFKVDVRGATVITAYLFPKLMDALLPKLERELPLGAKLYSVDFAFSGKQPVAEIDLGRRPGQLGRRLFVYQF